MMQEHLAEVIINAMEAESVYAFQKMVDGVHGVNGLLGLLNVVPAQPEPEQGHAITQSVIHAAMTVQALMEAKQQKLKLKIEALQTAVGVVGARQESVQFPAAAAIIRELGHAIYPESAQNHLMTGREKHATPIPVAQATEEDAQAMANAALAIAG